MLGGSLGLGCRAGDTGQLCLGAASVHGSPKQVKPQHLSAGVS